MLINVIHGDGNPTTFARMGLLPVSSSIQLWKPYRNSLCAVHLVWTLPWAGVMAPVVRAEPNGIQALLNFDGAYADLE